MQKNEHEHEPVSSVDVDVNVRGLTRSKCTYPNPRARSQTAPCAICPRSHLALVQVQASEWKVMVHPLMKPRMSYMLLHLAESHMMPAGDLQELARREAPLRADVVDDGERAHVDVGAREAPLL